MNLRKRNFPALAKKTFDRFKEQGAFLSITKRILMMLRKMFTSAERANYLHHQVDLYLKPAIMNPLAKERIACRRGCASCCHTQVSITGDEAQLLADKIISGKVEINFERLRLQARAKNDSQAWYRLSHESRKCVFLDENNECTIYADRPSVCRTNIALDDSKACSTENGIEKPVRLLNTTEADMAMMAGYIHASENGALPYMLVKALSNK